MINLTAFTGEIKHHFPSDPILQFIQKHPVIFPQRCCAQPLSPPAELIFTDGSAKGTAAIYSKKLQKQIQTKEKSAQKVELLAVIEVFNLFPQAFNLYTDSLYVANLFPVIETAYISENSTVSHYLLTLQQLIHQRQFPFFVAHIRSHSNLPGPLAEGNAKADQLTNYVAFPVQTPVSQAQDAHKLHHQNATALRLQFKITREQARQIIKQCPICITHLPQLHTGVNPKGLKPNALWQMDVTHIKEFGKLAFVHVTIDTYSHVLFASARTGEALKDVKQHVIQSMAYMGKPQHIKTDNAPAYVSKGFEQFCHQFHIKHTTGIPYNPQGQAVVERAHQTLKHQITKLQDSESKYLSPHHIINHSLFVINHLNANEKGETPMSRHWNKVIQPQILVKWKDVLTGQWKGPDVLLTSGRGYACIFPQDAETPVWIPDRLIRPISAPIPEREQEESPSSSAVEEPVILPPGEYG